MQDSLEFEVIKTNLVNYLKSLTNQNGLPVYQDYNFEASGINTLLNILAKNTHYIGYYIKMLLNESFIDSSLTKESLMSKAKLTGYIPKGMRSSRAEVKLKVTVDPGQEPSSKNIMIPRGTGFSGVNKIQDSRIFYNIDDVFISSKTEENNEVIYESDIIPVYEGLAKDWSFEMDDTIQNQRFVIKDKSIDIDTIRVWVYNPNSNNIGLEYKLSKSSIDIDKNSLVYYMSTNELGFYELVFGNNIFGKKPVHKSKIKVTYVGTTGESGNGCKMFRFTAPASDVPIELSISNWSDIEVTTISPSSGGMDAEPLENIRFSIPNNFKRQNRIVSKDDYRTILLSEFRNVDSINVWGGEENDIKDYGKIYISIKPKYGDKLTVTEKGEIKNRILNEYSVVGVEPVFVDPSFINVDLTINTKVDFRTTHRTAGEISRQINQIVVDYNDNQLNVFDNFLSDVKLLDLIMQDKSITTVYSTRTIDKDHLIIPLSTSEYSVNFGNSIKPGIQSSIFTYGENACYFKDDLYGKLYLYKTTGKKLIETAQGTINYEKGIIFFSFPVYASTPFNNINFKGTPEKPDIYSYLNNIVRIKGIKVNIQNAY